VRQFWGVEMGGGTEWETYEVSSGFLHYCLHGSWSRNVLISLLVLHTAISSGCFKSGAEGSVRRWCYSRWITTSASLFTNQFFHPYFSHQEFGVSLTFTSEESLWRKIMLVGHIPEPKSHKYKSDKMKRRTVFRRRKSVDPTLAGECYKRISTSVFVATKRAFSKPLSSSGLFVCS
jgi:hypothetical protein